LAQITSQESSKPRYQARRPRLVETQLMNEECRSLRRYRSAQDSSDNVAWQKAHRRENHDRFCQNH